MKLVIDGPNEKQALFLLDKHKYIAYGGARGGGKSWAVRTKAKLMALRYPGIRLLIVRRSYPELINNHINTLRKELLGQPVRLTEIAPGAVETEFSLVRFDGDHAHARPTLVFGHTYAWEPALRERLVALGQHAARLALDEVGELDTRIGHAFAAAAQSAIRVSISPALGDDQINRFADAWETAYSRWRGRNG